MIDFGSEIEQLIRRIVREELANAQAGESAPTVDDSDLQRRAIESATKLRRARGGAR